MKGTDNAVKAPPHLRTALCAGSLRPDMRVLARHPRQDDAGILPDAWFGATVVASATAAAPKCPTTESATPDCVVLLRFDDAAAALFAADILATVHITQIRVGTCRASKVRSPSTSDTRRGHPRNASCRLPAARGAAARCRFGAAPGSMGRRWQLAGRSVLWVQGSRVLVAIAPHPNPTVLAFLPATAFDVRTVCHCRLCLPPPTRWPPHR